MRSAVVGQLGPGVQKHGLEETDHEGSETLASVLPKEAPPSSTNVCKVPCAGGVLDLGKFGVQHPGDGIRENDSHKDIEQGLV